MSFYNSYTGTVHLGHQRPLHFLKIKIPKAILCRKNYCNILVTHYL